MANSRTHQETRQAIADADGTCAVRFLGPGVTYRQLAVSTIQLESDSALRCVAKLYRGANTNSTPTATEDNGKSGAFIGGAASDTLTGTERLIVQWTGATPGARCSATLVGTETQR